MAERKKRFKQVAPGILVSGDMQVNIDHPTECFILRNEADTASMHHDGALSVFSSEEKANAYIQKTGLSGAVIKPYQWDQLVDEFGERFGECLIDHRGEDGFYGTAPLKKGI